MLTASEIYSQLMLDLGMLEGVFLFLIVGLVVWAYYVSMELPDKKDKL